MVDPHPRTRPSGPPTGPGAAAPAVATASRPAGLTVADVVRPGAVVGVDDSDLVRGLLDDVLAARPAVVGTASLDALVVLRSNPAAVLREVGVRLFGGEVLGTVPACSGPRTARALTASGCDVALIGGRLVGTDIWVPADVRDVRHALLLVSRAAYLVLAADDLPNDIPDDVAGDTPDVTAFDTADDGADDLRRGWARLGPLTDVDGVVEVPAPLLASAGHRAA